MSSCGESDTELDSMLELDDRSSRLDRLGAVREAVLEGCWGVRLSWVADLVVTLLEVSTGESIMQFGVTLGDIVRVCWSERVRDKV